MAKIVEFSSLGGPDVLSFVECEPEPPGDGEAQIAVKAAGLNRAELLFMAGTYLVNPVLPSRLGFEGAGDVLAVGSGVDRIAPGDRVAITPAFKQDAFGVLGEVVNVPVSALEPIADGVSYSDAAAFWMAFGTAYGLLVQSGGLRQDAGQSVVLNAASSSVGTAAFQIIRAFGGTSIATTRDASKVEGLREAGADHVIVIETADVAARIQEATDGRGFDIACDAVGDGAFTTLSEAAGFEATLVVYGLLSGEVAPVPFYPMIRNGLKVTGFHLSWSMLDHPDRRAPAVAHLKKGLADGTYTPKIDKAFAFSDLVEAYRYMASNSQLGKIVIDLEAS